MTAVSPRAPRSSRDDGAGALRQAGPPARTGRVAAKWWRRRPSPAPNRWRRWRTAMCGHGLGQARRVDRGFDRIGRRSRGCSSPAFRPNLRSSVCTISPPQPPSSPNARPAPRTPDHVARFRNHRAWTAQRRSCPSPRAGGPGGRRDPARASPTRRPRADGRSGRPERIGVAVAVAKVAPGSGSRRLQRVENRRGVVTEGLAGADASIRSP